MPTTFNDFVIGILLSVWFVLSIVNQFSPRWFTFIQQFDRLGLLPIWTFFAPNPGQTDYHMIYRNMYADGSCSEWAEVEIPTRNGLVASVWNPDKRIVKAIDDAVAGLIQLMREKGERSEFLLSFSYLFLLNFVSAVNKDNDAASRQFAIVETRGLNRTETPSLLFVSEFHAIH